MKKTEPQSIGVNHTSFAQTASAIIKTPTELPVDAAINRAWQTKNKTWWERHPMRYDWNRPIQAVPGTSEYFREIDKRFLESVSDYLPWVHHPFEQFVDYASLGHKDVLEIGVGHGTHASLFAPHCKSYTGIDLTKTSVAMTSQRFTNTQVAPRIMEMDAERMSFADATFDEIWSWGVIHHSANTLAILNEMNRVLRSGGTATVMVYYRSWWKLLVETILIRGVILGQLFKGRSVNDILQSATDGAIARFYTPKQWRALCQTRFDVESVFITGLKAEILPIPHGRLKDRLLRMIPCSFSRYLTNRLRFGSFLIARMKKIEAIDRKRQTPSLDNS